MKQIRNTALKAFLLIIVGCQSHQSDLVNQSPKEDIDTGAVQKIMADTVITQNSNDSKSIPDSTVYVHLITRLSDSSEYYLPLYYRDEYAADIREKLIDSGKELKTRPSYLWRSIINDSLARVHLYTDHTESILVLNQNQNIVDTLSYQYFEHVSHEIEDFMATTYSSDLEEYNYLVMSNFGLGSCSIQRSPEVFEDSVLINKIIDQHKYKREQLYSYRSLIHDEDTLTYLSFTDYQKQTSSLHLFKNIYAVDSIFDHFIIMDILPVPLASKYELVYLTKSGIPDTEALWNSLIGIDLERLKFKFYPRNRLRAKG